LRTLNYLVEKIIPFPDVYNEDVKKPQVLKSFAVLIPSPRSSCPKSLIRFLHCG
jgi:hypothetical protein